MHVTLMPVVKFYFPGEDFCGMLIIMDNRISRAAAEYPKQAAVYSKQEEGTDLQ